MGNLLAHADRLGQGQDAAWDTSLWFWLKDGSLGDMETLERPKGPRPCPKARTGQLLPSLAEAASQTQVGPGLSQPPACSPQKAQPVWATGWEDA